MCDGEEPGQHRYVKNPHVTNIETLRQLSAEPLGALERALDGPESALSAGAWRGRPADRWEDELAGRQSRIRRAVGRFEHDLAAFLGTLDREVPECQSRGLGFP